MAKLTVAVAALIALSVAGTRAQAQSEQLASVDQFVSEEPVSSVDRSMPVEQAAPEEQLARLEPAMSSEILIVQSSQAPAAVEVAPATGPTLHAAALSPRRATSISKDVNAMRRPSRGSGVGLMILGGAALVTGLIIGDDAGTVIAVGGALIGLYGLYVYLGRPTGVGHNNGIGLGYKLSTH
jgi:hypothetical protein